MYFNFKFKLQITLHKKLLGNNDVVNCFGISQDPKTKNFMMVMKYIENGSMSHFLKNKYHIKLRS